MVVGLTCRSASVCRLAPFASRRLADSLVCRWSGSPSSVVALFSRGLLGPAWRLVCALLPPVSPSALSQSTNRATYAGYTLFVNGENVGIMRHKMMLLFAAARCCISAAYVHLSVCPSVRHVRVLCRNE